MYRSLPLRGLQRLPLRPTTLGVARPATTLVRTPTSTSAQSGAVQPLSKTPVRAITTISTSTYIRKDGILSVSVVQRRWASSSSSGSGSGSAKPPLSDGEKAEMANQRHSRQGIVQGAAEELRGAASGVAEIISGSSGQKSESSDRSAPTIQGAQEITSHSHGGSVKDDFIGITRSIFQSVPQPALMVGLAGTLPYLGTSLATVFLAREASRVSQGLNTISGMDFHSAVSALHTVEHIQITYGAVILSFLGAIHWGMEFSKLGGSQGYRRLLLGVLPVLYAWPTTFLPHGFALIAQWFGFTGTWALDQRASSMGWTTSWYATYRFYLSLIVGFSIIFTFAGTGHYGAGAGATTDASGTRYLHTTERVSPTQRVQRIHEAKHPKGKEVMVGIAKGEVDGDVETEEMGEDGDHYLLIRNEKKEEEEAKEKEEEEAKEKEEEEEKQKKEKEENEKFQDKRDQQQQEKAPGAMKNQAKNRTGENELAEGKDQSQSAKGGEDSDGGKDFDKSNKKDEGDGKKGETNK